MNEHKYRLTYSATAHPGGIEKKDVPENAGACDAMIFVSMIYPPDGSFSMMHFSKDGRTDEELPVAEIWKAWALMAKSLSENLNLSPGKRAFCASVFQMVADAMKQ